MNRLSLFIACALFVCSSLVHSQSIDSTVAVDTTVTAAPAQIDTMKLRFIPAIGRVYAAEETTSTLHAKVFANSDSKSALDVLKREPGFFFREQGEAGKPHQTYFEGVDQRSISFLLDGRPINDPFTGGFNSSQLALEGIEEFEIAPGMASLLGGVNSSATVNAVTHQYNSVRPITKLRYFQEPDETILTDGLFTQNIARGTNFMFGFLRQVTQGRFTNASLDSWGIRSRIRHNLSDRFNLFLSYGFFTARNGANGGVDPYSAAGAFEPKSALLMTESAWTRDDRYDWTLGAILKESEDSSFVTQFSLYSTSVYHRFEEPGGALFILTDTARYDAMQRGLRIQQSARLSFLALTLGSTIERRTVSSDHLVSNAGETWSSFFGALEIPIFPILVPSISIRQDRIQSASMLNIGAKLTSHVGSRLTLFAEATDGYRFPTMQERLWNDSTVMNASLAREHRKSIRAGLSLQFSDRFRIEATGYSHTINDAIAGFYAETPSENAATRLINVPKVTIEGITAKGDLKWWKFDLLGSLTYTKLKQQDTVKSLIPDMIVLGEAAFEDDLLNGAFRLRAGARYRFSNWQQGEQIHPSAGFYYESTAGYLVRYYTTDLFAVIHIGDAIVSLTFANVTDSQYIVSPVYPMPGRHFSLGINWVFAD